LPVDTIIKWYTPKQRFVPAAQQATATQKQESGNLSGHTPAQSFVRSTPNSQSAKVVGDFASINDFQPDDHVERHLGEGSAQGLN
jgi:hypothetical protein